MRYFIGLLFFSFSLVAFSESTLDFLRRIERNPSLNKVNAVIFWNGLASPVGKFLLIKTNGSICAIRFVKNYTGDDATTPSFFNTGEESLYAEYSVFSFNESLKNFTGERRGVLSEKSLIGLGRLAFNRGVERVDCNGSSIGWSYPNFLRFSSDSRARDQGVGLYPTNIDNIEDLDKLKFNDLNWYGLDEGRSPHFLGLVAEKWVRVPEVSEPDAPKRTTPPALVP